ncbi:galactonate dehydratase [Halorarum halophilum]|uniref:Galactonate dehydratase n=1 Tax=Halorarum halophilum TaxID=2743090 RepID=A0A7D5L2X7_9EURY|nr:galactonate dehydratase [Halobaculum halophilum]QLG28863.1 galactonate dehydratase [Halobaculum halophilum]
MRITDYELFEVPPRWQFLRLETSDGLVGWGEPYTKWHFVNGSAPATRSAVDQMIQHYVLDADPARIEDIWQSMYRSSFYRGGPVHMSAIAGIDEALWDIKGKRCGEPVHELLGGRVRDRIRVYEHVSVPHDEPVADAAAAAAREARSAVDEGYTAVKLVPTGGLERIDVPATIDRAETVVGAVREEVGPEVGVALDFHGRASKSMAGRLLDALEQFDPLFVEEPVLPEQGPELARLAEQTTVPLATGERLYSRWDFRPVLESGAVDVVQPDVSSAGGITETRKIAAAAETYDVALAPHCPIGPLALAASFQVDACAPNALVQEQVVIGEDRPLSYVEDPSPFEPTDGFLDVPEGPGLGVSIDEERVRDLDGEDLSFERPVGRRPDGSVGER